MPKPFTNWAVPPIPYSVSPFLSITPLCFGSSVHLHRFAEETICAGAKTHVLNYQYVFLEINVSTVLSLCVFTGKGQTTPFIQAPWFHFVNYTFLCIVLRVCRSSTVILDFWCFHGWKFPCSMSAGPLLVCGNVICFVLHSAAFKAVSYIWSWMLLVFVTRQSLYYISSFERWFHWREPSMLTLVLLKKQLCSGKEGGSGDGSAIFIFYVWREIIPWRLEALLLYGWFWKFCRTQTSWFSYILIFRV